MPAFSFSRPSCIVTIPISANATSPIQARPWIRRSSSGCVVTTVAGLRDGAARRAGARALYASEDGARDAARARGRGRPAAGADRGSRRARRRPRGAAGVIARLRARRACARRVARRTSGTGRRAPARARREDRSVCARACGRRAGARTRSAGCWRSPPPWARSRGASAARPRASRPQTQTGRSGGQMQPRARSARKRLTRRSSSEWNEIAASTPPSRSSSQASGSAVVELGELVVDGDPQRLEGALGRMAAGEARGRRDRGDDRLDELLASSRSARARGGGRSRGRSRPRSAPRRSRAARAPAGARPSR